MEWKQRDIFFFFTAPEMEKETKAKNGDVQNHDHDIHSFSHFPKQFESPTLFFFFFPFGGSAGQWSSQVSYCTYIQIQDPGLS